MKFKVKKLFPESELLSRLRDGDMESYRMIFVEYYPTVKAFIRGMTGDEAGAEDIAQNIFLKLWLNRQMLNPALSLRNYLFVLARNEVFNHFRSLRTGSNAKKTISERDAGFDLGPDSEFIHKETKEIIEKAVALMPPKRREVFVMSRFEGLSNREIAEKIGLSVRTVDKHIELALKDIRKLLFIFPLSIIELFF